MTPAAARRRPPGAGATRCGMFAAVAAVMTCAPMACAPTAPTGAPAAPQAGPTPDRYRAGALEPGAWNGVLMWDSKGEALGASFGCVTADGQVLDRHAVFTYGAELGPLAGDGRYHRVVWNPGSPAAAATPAVAGAHAPLRPVVAFEWRVAPADAVGAAPRIEGRMRVAPGCRPVAFVTRPWDLGGSLRADGDGVAGDAFNLRVSPAPRDVAGFASIEAAHMHARTPTPGAGADGSGAAAASAGPPEPADDTPVGTSAVTAPVLALRFPDTAHEIAFTLGVAVHTTDIDGIGERLADAREALEKDRVTSAGHLGGIAEAMVSSLHARLRLQPDTGRLYLAPGWGGVHARPDGRPDDFTIAAREGFFDALMLSVESPELARAALMAVLATQYDDGMIPSFRSASRGTRDRSAPPVGALVTIKLWGRLGQPRDLLAAAYPRLLAWHRWWRAPDAAGTPRRDGNRNGLLEWGASVDTGAEPGRRATLADRARAESGMADSPLWDGAAVDAGGHMQLDAVDLSSLFALDAECLAMMAEALGRADEAVALRQERDAMATAVNARLWDESAGFYVDRHWDGRLSRQRAASNLYPLVAGIASPERAARVRGVLNEPGFWTPPLLPTVPRDDAAFDLDARWRGAVQAITSYLAVQGLRRAGFREDAAAIAESGARLFEASWAQPTPAPAASADAVPGSGVRPPWRPRTALFALPALEELMDFDPFAAPGRAVRMAEGARKPRELRNLRFGGRRFDVRAGPDGASVRARR